MYRDLVPLPSGLNRSDRVLRGHNIRILSIKTPGCFWVIHPGVLGENIPMYLGKTSGCFDLSVLYSLGLSPGV